MLYYDNELEVEMIEIIHIAKIGDVAVSGRDDEDAKKKLADYLHTAAGREQFCSGLCPEEAEEKYQQALFQCYEEEKCI